MVKLQLPVIDNNEREISPTLNAISSKSNKLNINPIWSNIDPITATIIILFPTLILDGEASKKAPLSTLNGAIIKHMTRKSLAKIAKHIY